MLLMHVIERIRMLCKQENIQFDRSNLFCSCSDTCVLESYGKADGINDLIAVQSFIPFDPTTKRTEVTYQEKSNSSPHRVSKGMPDAILRLCKATEHADKVRNDVNEYANRGLRGLAVAISNGDENFQLIGLLPIFDPPREDTGETIKKAVELGVHVKMITGDQLEIAKETGRRLGMGDTMFVYEDLIRDKGNSSKSEDEIDQTILDADGFASVFPEHKFEIVKRLQDMGHLVAMTGRYPFDFVYSFMNCLLERRWCQRCSSIIPSECWCCSGRCQ